VVIVTNIDPEHLDHYGTFDAARQAYLAFVENIPFYGFAAMCIDHPEVQALIGRVRDRQIITYGRSPQADARLIDLDYADGESRFSVVLSNRRSGSVETIRDLRLAMPGDHNALNATGAIAVAHELGIGAEEISKGLKGFAGVKRRFTRTGSYNGIEVFDDYGHHPVEITAVLKAARKVGKGRVIAVVQPHRYTRLANLFDEFCRCFNDADAVVVAPVYAAGEQPIPGANHETLAEGLRDRGHRQVSRLDSPEELPAVIRSLAGPGDIVVCLGAGTITQWAYALPGQLAEMDAKRALP
jgi:UDP-N-acetylmuramate--alanine ligase